MPATVIPLRLLPPAARPTRSAPRPSLVTAEGRYDGKAIMDLAHTLARDDVADAARRGRVRRYKIAVRDALISGGVQGESRASSKIRLGAVPFREGERSSTEGNGTAKTAPSRVEMVIATGRQ